MSRRASLLRVARRAGKFLARAVAGLWLAYRALDLAFPLDEAAWRRLDASPVVRAADGSLLRVGLTDAGERVLVGDRPPSPHLVHALVAAEDRRFYAHVGVDLRALARAAVADVARGRAAEGASTITMQLARLVDPHPRTLAGKAVQVFRALQLEEALPKDEIVARYLARAPFGGPLRGAEAAARAWFGVAAADLAPEEAALLVSVLPSPSRYSPRRDAEGARGRRDRVLDRMHEEGFLDARALRAAKARPIRLVAEPFPLVAAHAVARAGDGTTTIDARLEAACERVAAGVPAPDGVAIVVLDVATGRVRALVGATASDARVLDATDRPRAAGSTLKPFLYALAFDRGLAAPGTRLLDLPWTAPDWEPSNFDRTFRGPVAASEALSLSLNVPAVRLAAALEAASPGRGAFVERLERLGLRRVRAPGRDAGADLAIGTGDVTPLELAAAYATLARGGLALDAGILDGAAPGPGRRALSAGACDLVTRILSDPSRPRPSGAALSGVAWKTGTSSRRRDAWAAGYTTRVAAVVWRGRLDGAPDPVLVGADAAAPLLFEVLSLADPSPRPFPSDDEGPASAVVAVDVCAETGLAAGVACPDRRRDLVPLGAPALAPCEVHLRVEVDRTTGALLCPRCRARAAPVARDVALRAPALAEWRAREGAASTDLPPHLETCVDPLEPRAVEPLVVSPPAGRVFEAGASGEASVPIRVLAPDPGSSLDVLVDGVPLGRVASGAVLRHAARAGRHTLTAVTASGRRTTASFEVRPAP